MLKLCRIHRLHRQLSERPWIIALIFSLVLVFWMASGNSEPLPEAAHQNIETPLPKVQVTRMQATSVERLITLYGRTEPDRVANLKAETAGMVAEILVKRGERVKAGQPLLRLAMNEREQLLKQAKAELAQREIEYEGAKKLSSQGFSGKAKLAEAKALLESARARVAQQTQDIQRTHITAPFDGVLNERLVEVGDYLGVGDPIAEVYDLNPLIIRADVGQREMSALAMGMQGEARLVTGELLSGQIRYLSRVADRATNTFRLELAVANSQQKLPAGLSAEMALPLAKTQAIKISPALLALDEEGNIGVKSVKQQQVYFTPIQLVKAEKDGVWLTGLGAEVDLITLGQGFVRHGDKVQVVYAKESD